MTIVHEDRIKKEKKPGRDLRWLITPDASGSNYSSTLIIDVPKGSTVKPAHAHPDGEEVIYIVKGKGRVWIDGEVSEVVQGSAVLFKKGSVHMLQNSGEEDMKVICFFAPAADFSSYKFYDDIDFPD
jgi:quercetin dioxygenase-like cupin family protein